MKLKELKAGATKKDIHKAFAADLKQAHPDKTGVNTLDAGEKIREIKSEKERLTKLAEDNGGALPENVELGITESHTATSSFAQSQQLFKAIGTSVEAKAETKTVVEKVEHVVSKATLRFDDAVAPSQRLSIAIEAVLNPQFRMPSKGEDISIEAKDGSVLAKLEGLGKEIMTYFKETVVPVKSSMNQVAASTIAIENKGTTDTLETDTQQALLPPGSSPAA
jgi:curved DNA-binding protein CbpA